MFSLNTGRNIIALHDATRIQDVEVTEPKLIQFYRDFLMLTASNANGARKVFINGVISLDHMHVEIRVIKRIKKGKKLP